ncbi:MAG: hypothetical protein ACM3JB_26320 [Acidobacteriaceae bacterium]
MTTSNNSNRQTMDRLCRVDSSALEASTETQFSDDTVTEETYELLPSGD